MARRTASRGWRAHIGPARTAGARSNALGCASPLAAVRRILMVCARVDGVGPDRHERRLAREPPQLVVGLCADEAKQKSYSVNEPRVEATGRLKRAVPQIHP